MKTKKATLLLSHPDDEAVASFAAAMMQKLKQKRAEGRRGWETAATQELAESLLDNLAKEPPNLINAANFIMMLWHQERYPKPIANGIRNALFAFRRTEYMRRIQEESNRLHELTAELEKRCGEEQARRERAERTLIDAVVELYAVKRDLAWATEKLSASRTITEVTKRP